ncbi:MAG TPA: BTAD domain-containing putative transcriptional regulator [Actinomycetota bacterium]|nr:BTAD domain-containing putative transcriptional regulator [Actinomycetota bacterium]
MRLGGRKQRSLLAAFVLHPGEFLSTDRLIEDLWRGDDGGATARLQVHVSQLRKSLGPDGELLETRPGGYVLSTAADAIDAHRFERLAEHGRVALACGDAGEARRMIRSALGLWRGPALGDLAYEPVGERDAARLEEIRLVATEDLIDANLALGRHRAVVGELEGLVAEHPLRERLRGQLMLALYRSGRQADALDAYAAARDQLSEQGLDPGPELEALQVAILRQDPDLLIEPAPAAAPPPGTPAPTDAAVGATLVERGDFLDTLGGSLEQARTGRGVLVFLGGEAGVGKTALVARFAEQSEDRARILMGACEGGVTPRPLGPVFDMLPGLREHASAGAADRDGDAEGSRSRESLFERFLRELEHEPCLVVVEDVHWADEATLDLLRHLGRRVSRLPALVVATYRDDEVGRGHPLTAVLDDMAALPSTRRMALPRLSEHGVATLAGDADVDAFTLFRSTGGNAFFVTEVLAARSGGGDGGPAVPATVRDAVLARAARLSPPAREALDAASVIGFRIEPWLLKGLIDGDADTVAECVERGMLRSEESGLAFRHELARLAIEESIPPERRVALHRRILDALVEAGAGADQAARLAHHAEAAGDGRAVLTYAPAAARRAAHLGAHRQAVQQYERARRFSVGMAEADRADLDERCAVECYLTDRIIEGIDALRVALDVRRRLGQAGKVGVDLRWLSRLSWYAGRGRDAEAYGDEAVEVLEGLPAGRELAYAYSNMSQLRMLAQHNAEAIEWGERAIALAEEVGDTEVLCHALNNVGTALLYLERADEGRPLLERSLEIAREADLDHHATRAYANLTSGFIILRRYAEADAWFGPALAYSEARDLDAIRPYLEGWRAVSHLEQGRWDTALAVARGTAAPQIAPVSRMVGLVVLGLVAARRGTADPWRHLDEALTLAEPTAELQRLWPVAVARAEAAWLEGDLAREAPLLRRLLPLADERGVSWSLGQIAFWLHRAGGLDVAPPRAAEPFSLQIGGRWAEAAERWQQIGCPYERATALGETDDAVSLRTAAEILGRLGAAPAAARVADRTRALGIEDAAQEIPPGERALQS